VPQRTFLNSSKPSNWGLKVLGPFPRKGQEWGKISLKSGNQPIDQIWVALGEGSAYNPKNLSKDISSTRKWRLREK